MITLFEVILVCLIVYPILRYRTFPFIEFMLYIIYKSLHSEYGHFLYNDKRFPYILVFLLLCIILKWYYRFSINECISLFIFLVSISNAGNYIIFKHLCCETRPVTDIGLVSTLTHHPLINKEWVSHHVSLGFTIYIKGVLNHNMVSLLTPFVKERKPIYIIQKDSDIKTSHTFLSHCTMYDFIYCKNDLSVLQKLRTYENVLVPVQTCGSRHSYSPYRSLRYSYTIPLSHSTKVMFRGNTNNNKSIVSNDIYVLQYDILQPYAETTLISIHNETHRVLNLIIYNPHSTYEQDMKRDLSAYLRTIPYLTFYFIVLRQQTYDVEVEGDCMYIKGDETFKPGILYKTLKSMRYCVDTLKIPFTYVVRSNISTAINYSQFPFSELSDNQHHYTGSDISIVNGLFPDNNFNLRYIQGICIILSHTGVSYLLKHEHEIDYETIDDVSIAKIMTKEFPIRALRYPRCHTSTQYITPNSIIFRNKSSDRNNDVVYMKKILNYFMN